MTTWTDLPDKAAGDAVTFEDWNAVKDHAEALASGATGAPSIQLAALGISGGGGDGAATDGVTPSSEGQYFYSSIDWSSNRTLPGLTWLYIQDGGAIAGTLTLGSTPSEYGITVTNGVDMDGSAFTGGGSGGGAGWGAGGDGVGSGGTTGSTVGGAGQTFPSLNNPYLIMPKTGGGRGGNISDTDGGLAGGVGGGFLGILCDGDLDLSGLTLVGDGGNGTSSSSDNDWGTGGGGGGGLYIVCRGELTLGGADFSLTGGNGGAYGTPAGGGGGGGLFQAIAPTITGTPTVDVSGGSGPGSATDGSAGRSNYTTVSASLISAMFYSLGLLGR